MAVYRIYIKAASMWKFLFFLMFAIAFQAFQVCRSYWLSKWWVLIGNACLTMVYYHNGMTLLRCGTISKLERLQTQGYGPEDASPSRLFGQIIRAPRIRAALDN